MSAEYGTIRGVTPFGVAPNGVIPNGATGKRKLKKQLTALQTRVLKTIAEIGGKEPYSSRFCDAANVHSTTSIRKAIAKIEKEELAYWFDGDYRFVNPFFREWLRRQ